MAQMFIMKNVSQIVMDLNGLNDDVKAVMPKVIGLIGKGADQYRVNLTDNLTAQEDSDLDDLIANFVDSDPEQKIPVIYDLVEESLKSKHFHNIDYKTELEVKLQRKTTIIQGEVQKVEWFQSASIDMSSGIPILVYTDKVLEINVSYVRDPSGFALYKQTTRHWVQRDGELHPDSEDLGIFYYEDFHKIQEGKRRRKLLVDSIQFPTLYAMLQALMPVGYQQDAIILKGRRFMDEYEDEFNKFVDNSSTVTDPASPDFNEKSVVVKIRDEDDVDHVEWLDKSPAIFGGSTTIRQYLMNEFDI